MVGSTLQMGPLIWVLRLQKPGTLISSLITLINTIYFDIPGPRALSQCLQVGAVLVQMILLLHVLASTRTFNGQGMRGSCCVCVPVVGILTYVQQLCVPEFCWSWLYNVNFALLRERYVTQCLCFMSVFSFSFVTVLLCEKWYFRIC